MITGVLARASGGRQLLGLARRLRSSPDARQQAAHSEDVPARSDDEHAVDGACYAGELGACLGADQ